MGELNDRTQSRGLSVLTAGDWIGVVVAVLSALGCGGYSVFAAPVWRGMFEDFGARATLPVWTAIGIWPPFGLLLGGLSLGFVAAGLFPRSRGIAWRRAWIVGAFLLAALALAFMAWAVRLPLWELANAVQA